MRSSPILLLASTSRVLSSYPGPTAGSTAARASQLLPRIRYHLFREPLPYPVGLRLQNDIIDMRLRWKEKGKGKQDIVLFLEHTPTYTTGRRDNSPNPTELHPEEKKVQHVGAEFHITKRGGQVTYHGPGQLVGYPIMDLNNMEMSTRCYVEYLQGALAEYLTEGLGCEGVLAPHPEGHVGVFASPSEKVASIGIHLRRRITSHGFAMNVLPTPVKWFDLILACGLADVRAISIHDMISRAASASGVLPPRLPMVPDVARGLIPGLTRIFGRTLVDLREGSGDGDVQEEVEELRGLCNGAGEEATRANWESGGWLAEPDLSRREMSGSDVRS